MNFSGPCSFANTLLFGPVLVSADALYRDVQAQSLIDNSLGVKGSVLNSQGSQDLVTGGAVRGSTQGPQDAGDVYITAGQVLVSGMGINGLPSSIEVQSSGTRAAVVLRVDVDNLTIRDRAQEATAEAQFGHGGNILLSLDD